MTIPTLKQLTIELVKTSPDTVSEEELRHKVKMAGEVLYGLQNGKEGKTLTIKQLLQNIQSW